MKILLLTRNHVVREFIELVADRMGAVLDVRDSVAQIEDVGYDYLFVDDRGVFLQESMALVEGLDTYQNIVLYNETDPLHEKFDLQIKKPFLPSDIQAILEQTPEPKEHDAEDQILNLQDIDEIKSLLEDEGLEIVAEEDLVDEIDTENAYGIMETEPSKVEEKLLQAITKMEPKKIRKLLKGAEITLSIRFPKESK